MFEITPEMMKDAAQYANFSQRVKMEFWHQEKSVPEHLIEDLLLLAWRDIKKFPPEF